MAIVKAVSLIVSALVDAASLVWMELAMFAVAAIFYICFISGGQQRNSKQMTTNINANGNMNKSMDKSNVACGESRPDEIHEHASRGNHQGAIDIWKNMKSMKNVPSTDLACLLESMVKMSWSLADIGSELESALVHNDALLPLIVSLPASLLRDDAADLADVTLAALEKTGNPPDVSLYSGLMAAYLRRRGYASVADVGLRVPSDKMTSRMRAILASAAAQRNRLDEALGHLRQMPNPSDSKGKPLAPGVAMQILTLASREQRVNSAVEELIRLKADLLPKPIEELISAAGRKQGPIECRALMDAAINLSVPLGTASYQALATSMVRSGESVGIKALVDDLEVACSSGTANAQITEPLALVLLEGCRISRKRDLALRVFKMHEDACAGAPGGRILAAVCAVLLETSDPQDEVEALEFYEKQMAARALWPDAALTRSLLKAAANLGRTDLAQRLSDHEVEMKQHGSNSGNANNGSDLQRHAAMIKAYGRERDLKGAAAAFERLRSSGTHLNQLIYNCFLDACVQCGDVVLAIAHFEEMKRLNFVDIVGYNTLLKAHLARGHTDEAQRLVKEMTERGLQANKVTYNELIHAKVVARDRKSTWELVKEMQRAGVRPNSVTCSILLKSLTGGSEAEDIREVVALIESIEESIDEVLFSSVIEACIRIGQLDLLSDLMRRYRLNGGFANLSAPTYGSMIKAYGQSGQINRVRELWQEMMDQGVKPTSITLGCMTEALVANSMAEEAFELVHNQLENEEMKGCINTVIYSTVLKGFATTKRIDKVFMVYKEMRVAGIPCNTITYNTLLDACAKTCAMSRASNLLEDMAESCVEPDIITYSTIIKGYCVEGDVDKAFQVLEDMKSDDKFAPDEIMYNSILDGCAKQHRVEDALRVLEEMKNAGVTPSNYTLSILVKILGHARRLGPAFKMVEELSKESGFRPNIQVYTCLAQACVLNRRLERAMTLYNTMIGDEACVPDNKFYAVFARGCLQLHQPWKAVEVIRAAYRLPGHSLAEPPSSGRFSRIVGVEMKALEDVGSKMLTYGAEERETWAALVSELEEKRGVRISSGSAGRNDGRRKRGGAGRNYGR